MRVSKYLHSITLGSVMLALSLTSSQAQTANATWTGPASGGLWNTPADWDIGIPAEGTNVAIGTGTNITYNAPMAATSVGIVTNNGTLNIGASGFNCLGIVLPNPAGGDKVFINSGGIVSVGGNFTLSTNAAVTMAAGSTLTVNGAVDVSFGASSHAAGTVTFTNNGGAYTALSTVINNNQGTASGLMVINGGTNSLGNTSIGRSSSGATFGNLGTEGLVVYNGFVTTTNLNVGNNGQGVSSLSAWIDGGVVTNQGNVFINGDTGGRGARFIQSSGLFVVPDPGVVNPNGYANGTVPSSAVINIYSINGGTNVIGGLYLGNSNGTALATINITNNAVTYIGSQGIASNGAATVNISLGGGGLFGASASWLGTVPMKLAGGLFTFQAADMSGNPNNITLSNILSSSGGLVKTGGGTLTLDATNTYAGATMIDAGTLSLGGSGLLPNSVNIFVGSGATYDVSQTIGYTISGTPVQTLSGLGTVNGAVNVASGGTIYAGSNSFTGTLTINGGLTESGGAVNVFQLGGSPTGPNNSLLNASGGFTVSGANTIQINGNGLQSGGVYALIHYGSGGFSGTVSGFTLAGATGVLSNSVTAQTIYLINQTAVRAATNLTWVGSIANNNWDIETTLNWVDTGSPTADYFVPGDNVLLGNSEATNVINVVGSPTPGSIIVNTKTNYTITGLGTIDGNGTLTVSNGTLTILTTNNFNAPVVLDGGVLSTPVIANSSNPSGIGEASSSPANLVFNGGTFNFFGGSASTDHGLTLTNGGGTIDVSNGAALTITGPIVGNGTLTVDDTGVLALNSANPYTNTTFINGGFLQLLNAQAAGTGLINFNNGTLAFAQSSGITVNNAFNFTPNTTNTIINTSGSGGNPISAGTWTGGGILVLSNSFNPFTVNGSLEGFSGTLELVTPATSSAQIQFRLNSGGGNTTIGGTNVTFDLVSTNVALDSRNPGVMDIGALEGALGTTVTGPSSTAGIVIWSIGANNLSTVYSGYIQNGPNANEASSLAKVGTGNLVLQGGEVEVGFPPVLSAANLLTYTGPTIVSNGTLSVISPDALVSTNVILAAASAILDASQMGFIDPNSGDAVTNSVFEPIAGQTFEGIGTVYGFLTTDAGSTLNVGLPGSGNTGTLTVTNAVTLNGLTISQISRGSTPNVAKLVTPSTITVSGALVVTNVGAAPQGSDSFQLFSASSIVGTFSSVSLPTLEAGQSWNTANLYVNGTISVVGTGTPPNFSQFYNSGSDVVFNATNGSPQGQVTILATTNLTLPLAQWSTLTTGNFDNSGNFSYTYSGALASGKPRQFFILHVP